MEQRRSIDKNSSASLSPALALYIISEFGVPAVNLKIACDWERVGIKKCSFKSLRVKFFDDHRFSRKKIAGEMIFT